jgi:hypothetical protein
MRVHSLGSLVFAAGPILRASCKASDGSRVDTTINTLDCRGGDISVKPNGKLTCK